MNENKQPALVLASSSKYRRAQMRRLGLEHVACTPGVRETPHAGESVESLVERLSKAKAEAVAPRYPEALIIGSDECASLDDELIGKPGGFARARAQLLACSGRTLVFHTGVCVLDARARRHWFENVQTRVRFRRLTRARIESYLRRDEPYDCAGSFRSEGLGGFLCESIESDDPTALPGLPVIALSRLLEKAGFHLL